MKNVRELKPVSTFEKLFTAEEPKESVHSSVSGGVHIQEVYFQQDSLGGTEMCSQFRGEVLPYKV